MYLRYLREPSRADEICLMNPAYTDSHDYDYDHNASSAAPRDCTSDPMASRPVEDDLNPRHAQQSRSRKGITKHEKKKKKENGSGVRAPRKPRCPARTLETAPEQPKNEQELQYRYTHDPETLKKTTPPQPPALPNRPSMYRIQLQFALPIAPTSTEAGRRSVGTTHSDPAIGPQSQRSNDAPSGVNCHGESLTVPRTKKPKLFNTFEVNGYYVSRPRLRDARGCRTPNPIKRCGDNELEGPPYSAGSGLPKHTNFPCKSFTNPPFSQDLVSHDCGIWGLV